MHLALIGEKGKIRMVSF